MNKTLWLVLALTFGATLYVSLGESSDVVESQARTPPRGAGGARDVARQVAIAPTDEMRLRAVDRYVAEWLTRKQGDQQWDAVSLAWAAQLPPPPPPPPPVVYVPPPPPMAPVFPHQWVGRYVDVVERAVVVSTSQTWVVKAGDVLDSQWRIEKISERQMQVTYLPLSQHQTVSMK